MASIHSLRPTDLDRARPIYVAWELTRRRDHGCSHCGSRAKAVREEELDAAELLAVADALIDLGTREVSLSAGETVLRSGVYRLIEHLAEAGIRVTLQTGGRGLTAARALSLREAGLMGLSSSIDGTRRVHDTLRASPGATPQRCGRSSTRTRLVCSSPSTRRSTGSTCTSCRRSPPSSRPPVCWSGGPS